MTKQEFWTPERIDLLTHLRVDRHKSCSEIAGEIGDGCTRNAVMGKLSRLGIPSPNRPSHPYVKKPKPLHKPAKPKTPAIAPWSRLAPRKGVQPPKNPEGRSRKATAPGNGILLVNLERGQCKWSIGYDKLGNHLFCAAPQYENMPYCAEHHKRSIRERT